jgi:carbon monoxide dehydrogenase subunit G
VTPDAVWAVLADGSRYADWVVGTSRIRDVDATWPEPGARLHYRISLGPAKFDGHTEVVEAEPGRHLVLEAHGWPAGAARIELTLDDVPEGCRITLVEFPARGAAALLHNPFGDLLLKGRNVETLRRLDSLARRAA